MRSMYFINELGGSLQRRTVYTCSHKWSCMIGLFVLSEVLVTVGVPEAFALPARVASQFLASLYTKCEMFGHATDAGSLMNETSCLGIENDVGDSPE